MVENLTKALAANRTAFPCMNTKSARAKIIAALI